jgi:hypothetical protein
LTAVSEFAKEIEEACKAKGKSEANKLVCELTKMPKNEWICTKVPQDNERGVLPSERLLAFDSG